MIQGIRYMVLRFNRPVGGCGLCQNLKCLIGPLFSSIQLQDEIQYVAEYRAAIRLYGCALQFSPYAQFVALANRYMRNETPILQVSDEFTVAV
jgi:hypothetical protein